MRVAAWSLVGLLGCASTGVDNDAAGFSDAKSIDAKEDINADGKLSDGTPIDATPIDAPGGSGVVQENLLAAGGQHTCAIHPTTRAVRCWGRGSYGQLGYGNTSSIGEGFNEVPKDAGDVQLNAQADSIVAGDYHTCVIHSNGTAVRCWGDNANGVLGISSTTDIGDNEVPTVDVQFGNGSVLDISTGDDHTCILVSTNDRVRCWGAGQYGRTGYGNTSTIGDNEHPEVAGDVNTGATLTVVDIDSGYDHTCALFSNGHVRCWGLNDYGQLGYGHTQYIGDNETPANSNYVDFGGALVKEIAAGNYHTCALMMNGDVRCWGRGSFGSLGLGSTSHVYDPSTASAVSLPARAIRIDAGGLHTCALLENENLICWGNNGEGQLGIGNTDIIGDNESPTVIVGLNGQKVKDFATGDGHTCAKVANDSYYCWGYALYGRLGYGNQDNIGDNELPYLAGPVMVW